MTMVRQFYVVIGLGLCTIPRRLGDSVVIVLGMAIVVGVFVSMMSMVAGLKGAVEGNGRDDRVIVLRGGSQYESASSLSMDTVSVISDAPGIEHDANRMPLASSEAFELVELPERAGGDANIVIRGIKPIGTTVRPEIKLVAGRWFKPGVRELVVGSAVQKQFDGVSIGDHIVTTGNNIWTVVGSFESGGSVRESELLTDADTLMSAYSRDYFQSVTAIIESPNSFNSLKMWLSSRPQLTVNVETEKMYLASQSRGITEALRNAALTVGAVMSVGAFFGALNTMFSAVNKRTVEIATLRAIGFNPGAVVVSVLVESMLLATIGGAIGALIAWLIFEGHAANSVGGGYGQLLFHLHITMDIVEIALALACIVGLAGGLVPGLRAVQAPIAKTLKGR